jgi:hypothetical protein
VDGAKLAGLPVAASPSLLGISRPTGMYFGAIWRVRQFGKRRRSPQTWRRLVGLSHAHYSGAVAPGDGHRLDELVKQRRRTNRAQDNRDRGELRRLVERPFKAEIHTDIRGYRAVSLCETAMKTL